MSQNIDEFVINFTLQRLERKIDQHKVEQIADRESIENSINTINNRTTSLEENKDSMTGVINSLIDIVTELQNDLHATKNELNKTKMINIKQDIVIRTLHNLEAFHAHDMHVDTFVTDQDIDWDRSIRAIFIEELQAVGRIRAPIVIQEQIEVPSFLRIGGGEELDNAIAQSFAIDQSRVLHKINVFLEPHNDSSSRYVEMRVTTELGGEPISSSRRNAADIHRGWIDFVFDNPILEEDVEYFLEIHTDDPNGYRIGMDLTDRYLRGTSYSLYNDQWMDNYHDIGFQVWCYPSLEEDDATIISKTKTLSTMPTSIVFEKKDTLSEGIINYHVSRDNGLTWKILQPGIETSLNDLPEGNELVLMAYITGNSYIEAWGYVVKRSDHS